MGLLLDRAPVSETGRSVAKVKRFLEWYGADPAVREAARSDPKALAERLGLDVDPVELRPLWDETVGDERGSALVQEYRAFIVEKLAYRDRVREEGSPVLGRMRRWRERQIARCRWELPSGSWSSIVHSPLTLELCRGCSVGCWFCGVAAPKLTDTWRHSDHNAALWRGVLGVFGQVLGKAGEQGFCYWATDPLDNPDYEAFCLDFAQVMGVFPQTTTALALKDVERTRRLLLLSREHGCVVNRFSLLTLNQVRRVMQSFTPEELLYVELVLQNPESTSVKAAVGKARERALETEGTIACVSGFHVNMVDGVLQVMTPCLATDERPLGYHVMARGSFGTLEQFGDLLHRMTAMMTDHLDLDRPVRFWPGLRFEPREAGFRLVSTYCQMDFTRTPVRLGALLAEGRYSVREVVASLEDEVPLDEALLLLEDLFAAGLLEERTDTVALG